MKKLFSLMAIFIIATSIFTSCDDIIDPINPADKIMLDFDKLKDTVEVGKTVTLIATLKGSTDAIAWSSDKTEIATVASGVVTGVAEGSAIITAKVGELTATCIVTVTKVGGSDTPVPEGQKMIASFSLDGSIIALEYNENKNIKKIIATHPNLDEGGEPEIITADCVYEGNSVKVIFDYGYGEKDTTEGRINADGFLEYEENTSFYMSQNEDGVEIEKITYKSTVGFSYTGNKLTTYKTEESTISDSNTDSDSSIYTLTWSGDVLTGFVSDDGSKVEYKYTTIKNNFSNLDINCLDMDHQLIDGSCGMVFSMLKKTGLYNEYLISEIVSTYLMSNGEGDSVAVVETATYEYTLDDAGYVVEADIDFTSSIPDNDESAKMKITYVE